MADNASNARFKPEMPAIPGVQPALPPSGGGSPRLNPLLLVGIAALVLALLILVGVRLLSHHRPVEQAKTGPPAQIEVPPPPPDPNSLLPHATEANPVIGNINDFSKPWSSAVFFIRNTITGEDVPATIVRLPTGSPARRSSYWAFSRKAIYGTCQLEYIYDLDKLRQDYGYKSANHPLVGNPCTRVLYDPLKTTNLPGNLWIRGAIIQGSDVRPPIGVEIQIQGKNVLATRTE
jgi:hypothetical protein